MLHLENVARAMGTPAGLATAGSGHAPQLGMPDPSDTRSAWISGSLSFGIHAGLIGALALFAWLNPEVLETVIPVKIVRELPGSNEEPAPKTLVPRRAAVAQNVAPRQVTKAVRPAVTSVSAETLQMAQVDLQAAPTQLDRRAVTAQRVTVGQAVQRVQANVSNLAIASPVAIRPGAIRAPVAAAVGPARVDTSAPSAAAPAFNPTSAPVVPQARSAASLSDAQFAADAPSGIGVATEVSDRFLSGGGTGGSGKAVGVVRCDESAFVQRYYAMIRDRTITRWEVPDGTADRAKVVLRFRLDDSGSASDVAFVEAANPELGNSAVAALREASPFPPLNSNTRCISENELRAIFTVPEA